MRLLEVFAAPGVIRNLENLELVMPDYGITNDDEIDEASAIRLRSKDEKQFQLVERHTPDIMDALLVSTKLEALTISSEPMSVGDARYAGPLSAYSPQDRLFELVQKQGVMLFFSAAKRRLGIQTL